VTVLSIAVGATIPLTLAVQSSGSHRTQIATRSDDVGSGNRADDKSEVADLIAHAGESTPAPPIAPGQGGCRITTFKRFEMTFAIRDLLARREMNHLLHHSHRYRMLRVDDLNAVVVLVTDGEGGSKSSSLSPGGVDHEEPGSVWRNLKECGS
jgi:hypothetical protein